VAAVFEASNLTKQYDGRQALSIRRLRIERGAVHGLIGPNGSGKSTLLEILAGLSSPTAGELLYDGRPVPQAPAAARRLAGRVTLVLQHPFMFRGTVRDNVEFGLRARGVRRRQAVERVERQMAALGLLELAGRDARRLSGGEIQRVALARALVLDTPVVLLDEPLSHVDAEHRQTVLSAVRALRTAGRTAVIAAHDLGELGPLADRVIELGNGGRPTAEKEVEESG